MTDDIVEIRTDGTEIPSTAEEIQISNAEVPATVREDDLILIGDKGDIVGTV